MKLSVVASDPGLTRIACADDITVFDFTSGNPLKTLLEPEAFGGTVLLDLASSAYIDSSGVGWLMQCHSCCQKAGGRLIVHSIAPMVNHCFRVLGMYDVLQIAANEEAALKIAASHGDAHAAR